jgi:hypothetical protein
MSEGTLVLNEQSVAAYKELLQNPGGHGLPFRPIKECFKPADVATPKDVLFNDFVTEVPSCPKVIFYIIMDELYTNEIANAPDGKSGYKLQFIKL